MQDFRSQICVFLDSALTEDLRHAGRNTTGLYSDPSACAIWHRRLYQAGWIAPAWPKAWGGAGWNEQQRAIFDAECIERDAPLLINAGIRSIGPLLIEMGAPLQRQRYLPPILSGDELWCQGFSEPGAGSDLTAISSQGRVEGNQLILNGQKIWTTAAHLAQFMFALFRTDPQSRGGVGLTFVLLDMSTPGVSVRPIFDLRGEHEFNQVFFDEVVVNIDNCVGAINEGWRVAKRLMTLARANNSPASHTRRILRQLRQTLPHNISSTLRIRLAEIEIELEAFSALEQASAGADAAAMRASLLKIRGSELKQKACELALDVADAASEAQFSMLVRQYLGSRAASIYSGTNEIQRNLVARALVR